MGPLIVRVRIYRGVEFAVTENNIVYIQAIINFSDARVAAQARGEPLPHIGRGVGMAIGIFCTTVTASVCQHQVGAVTSSFPLFPLNVHIANFVRSSSGAP